MGSLRTKGFYKTKARIFRDSTQEVTLRWFRVPDGTPFFPKLHMWGGLPWRDDRFHPPKPLGELTPMKLTWDAGNPPVAASALLGSDDWWRNGVPIAAVGVGPDQVRPGICTPNQGPACVAGCGVAPLVSPVWEMDFFEVPGLDPKILWNSGGCSFTSCCYSGSPQAPAGTSGVWLVSMLDPVPGLSETVVTAVQGSLWSSCCHPTM
jgi:hypothetical protein